MTELQRLNVSNPYITFNKLILFTVEAYITRSIEDGLSVDPLHLRLKSAIKGYMIMSRFSKEEAEKLFEFGKDPRLQRITEQDVSFLVFALELMKLLIEDVPRNMRPHLNISDKRLKIGRGLFVVDMLKIKKRDEKRYKEFREIIDTSVVTAKQFYAYHFEKLVTL